MAGSLFENNTGLSNIDYSKLTEKIIEIDSEKAEIDDSKRIYFDENTLELKNIIHIAGEVAQSLFEDKILANSIDAEDITSKSIYQCESNLNILGINSIAKPRKVCSNYSNVAEQEKAFKSLKEHFKDTVLKDIELSRSKGSFDTRYPYKNVLEPFVNKTENTNVFYNLDNINFNFLNNINPTSIDLCEMEHKDKVNVNKQGVTRTDTLLIEAEIDNLDYKILTAVLNYYGKQFKRDPEKQKEIEALLDKNSDIVQKLKNFIIGLRSGYLKRTSQFLYLDCLKSHFSSKLGYHTDVKYQEGFKLFSNYVDRFFKFEALMEDILLNSRMIDFGLDYNGIDYNYNEGGADLTYLFREAHIYSALPFIGAISDPLSDSTDSKRENGQELYGIHTKMNGIVAKDNTISYKYHLKTIQDFTGKEYELKEGRRAGAEIAKALVFKFFLLELDNPDYDPVNELEGDIERFRYELVNEDSIKNAIKEIYTEIASKDFKIDSYLSKIKNVILNGLSTKVPFTRTYERKLSILSSMLPKDISQQTADENILNIMSTKGFNAKLIKYTTLLEDEFIDASVFSFNYKFTITSNLIQPKDKSNKTFKIGYHPDIQDRNLTNFVLFPCFPTHDVNYKIKNKEVQIYKSVISHAAKNLNAAYIQIPYLDSDAQLYAGRKHTKIADKIYHSPSYRLAYELVYTIILNTLVSLIAEDATRDIQKTKKKGHLIHVKTLYRPIESKGEYEKRNPRSNTYKAEWSNSQTFIKNISKSLEFILSNLYNCKSQGYDISTTGAEINFKKKNANTSLNSSNIRVVNPINAIQKLKDTAVIVGTSVKIDEASKNTKNLEEEEKKPYKALIYGEVVLFKANEKGDYMKLMNFEKYHEFTDEQRIHKTPEIFTDIVSRLSDLGISNIIYIVKAPYTTKMLEKPDDTEMYFMNESILTSMSSVGPHINIYPLYVNSIRTFNCDERTRPVMYTCDAKYMCQNLFEENRGMFPILQMNIHNPVNTKDGAINYSSLITYSTISGMYKDPKLKKSTDEIKTDVILKSDLLSILTAHHASRYEKFSSNGKSSIKKDPYEYLIGNKSIGRTNATEYTIEYPKHKIELELNYLGLGCSIFRSINEL